MAEIRLLSDIETGRTPHWKAAVWSGIGAGLIFLVLEMFLVSVFAGGSAWAPVRMIGAILMGREALPPPATFDFTVFLAALLVHAVLAVVYGLILSLVIFRLGTGWAIVAGAIFGLLLYLVNFYWFTAAFPWFAMARNGVSVFAHIVFGVAAAWIYKELARREIVEERHPA